MAHTPAVVLTHITKSFHGRSVVEDLSLTVARGEFFSLLGPSGTGKTTVLRLCAGFETPDVGTIEIDGRSMADVPPHRRPVNTVFQSYALFPHLTVEDNVGFGLRMQSVPSAERTQRVGDALMLLKLDPLRARLPSRLSGGEQQRVAIARAIVNRPAVVLLDEPMSALDEPLRQAMLVDLQEIQRRLGTTFVCVTHHQQEALAVSDRVGVMQAGRLVQVGTPREVYEQPASRFVAEFLGQANVLTGPLVSTQAGGRALSVPGVALPLRVPVYGAPGTAALSAGQRATLVVRPDVVRFASSDTVPQDQNVLHAQVESVRYGGATWHYRLRVAGQALWMLTVPTGGVSDPPHRPGARMVIQWAVAQSSLLPEAFE